MSRRNPRPLPTTLSASQVPSQAEAADPWTKRNFGPSHSRLVGQVEKHLIGSRGNDNRFIDVVHPSDLAKEDWCPRRTAYELLHVSPSDSQRVTGFNVRIFDDGKLIHRKWQGWLRDMGVLYGEWRCTDCGAKFRDTSPSYCISCRSPRLEYREVPVEQPELRIFGRADGMVDDYLVEIKGISPGTVRVYSPAVYYKWLESLDGTNKDPFSDLWKQVKRPFNEHRRQGLLYCAITEVPEILFLYEWKVNQQIREFVVKRNDGLVEDIFDAVEVMVEAVERRELPPRPGQFSLAAAPCMNCQYRSKCWSANGSSS